MGSVQRKSVVGTATFGRDPTQFVDRIKTMRFVFPKFKRMDQKQNEVILSPVLKTFGHSWAFQLLPRGNNSSSIDIEYISYVLSYVGDTTKKYKPTTKFCILVAKVAVFDHH